MLSRWITASADVEVCIDEFPDEAIVEEVRLRNLTAAVLGISESDDKKDAPDISVMVLDVLNHLLGGRHFRAADSMQALLAAFIPEYVNLAAEAMRAGRTSEAICYLDRLIEPSPAATAKELPKDMRASAPKQ